MTINEKKKDGYITLKEASERFGYAPDYIGQLIRKGKIEGQQVYANVAWMTTAEAMEEYVAKSASTTTRDEVGEQFSLEHMLKGIFSPLGSRILALVLRVLIGILIIIALAVFYMLSVAFDHHLIRSAEKELAARVITLDELAPSTHGTSGELLTYNDRHE